MTLDRMTLDRIAIIAADFAAHGFHPRPFLLGIAAGLIAPYAVRLLAWML